MKKKISLNENLELLFEMDQKIFTREFDSKFESMEQVESYYYGSEIYLFYSENTCAGILAYKHTNYGSNPKKNESIDKSIRKNSVNLVKLAVLPEFQGRGLGSQMLEYFKETNSKKDLFLTTHPRNRGGVITYLKSGFEIYGWIDNFEMTGEPRLKLRLLRTR